MNKESKVRHREDVPFTALLGEKIKEVKFGNSLVLGMGSYAIRTIIMESGREFTFSSCGGEPVLCEVK